MNNELTFFKDFEEYASEGNNYAFNRQVLYRFPNGCGASVVAEHNFLGKHKFYDEFVEVMPITWEDDDYKWYSDPFRFVPLDYVDALLREIFEFKNGSQLKTWIIDIESGEEE